MEILIHESIELLEAYHRSLPKKNQKIRIKLLIQLKKGIVKNYIEFAKKEKYAEKTLINWLGEYKRYGLFVYAQIIPKPKESELSYQVKNGYKCIECGIYFERKYGKPTICKSCLKWRKYQVGRKFKPYENIANE